uniref:Uncharacterized protein n=1 Tax=viral metagenome TaxID=1070528 RepID=A0A6C0EE24_9ZZZZ
MGKSIPMYVEPNNPSIPNEQKQIFAEKMGSRPPPKEPQQLVNLQVYQPPQPPRPRPEVNPMSFLPSFVYNPLTMPPQYGMYPPYGVPQIPIIKTYNISTRNPNDEHTVLNTIYEDVLPFKSVSSSGATVSERMTYLDYVRNVLFPKGDGTETSLFGSSQNSLMSHIKFLELNPYYSHRFSQNPYRGLPDGFLLYRSCYPIRINEVRTTSCAKNAMGINVRIYKMSEGAFMDARDSKEMIKYDQWRDVAFYEHVREKILKTKMCPSFSLLFGYYLCLESGIDFTKMDGLKKERETNSRSIYNVAVKSLKYFMPDEKTGKKAFPAVAMPSALDLKIATMDKEYTDNKGKIDKNEYKGKVLVAMTEASTYSLFTWASKVYQTEGNINRMINTGLHSEKEWFIIFFQILVALYSMQLTNTVINNFSLERNVYIKDLNLSNSTTSHWKYCVKGIDYYIPNMGFLAVIDSNYRDLEDNTPTYIVEKKDALPKMMGEFVESKESEIKDNIFNMLKNAFDPNNFNIDFINIGGVKPPEKVINFLTTISKDIGSDTTKDIGIYIQKYMKMFIHNRIGTYLKEAEVQNLRREDAERPKKGDIVVLQESGGKYKFGLYVESEKEQIKIITKENPTNEDYIEKTYPSFISYSKTEPIAQTFKIGETNFSEENLLETYTIN